MTTKVKSCRINITDEPLEWDALVIWANWSIVTTHLWTVSSLDAGTEEWTVPVLWENWRLPDSTMSSDVMKKSVYDLDCKQADVYDYRNFTNTPCIPVVNDPVVTFTQGWVTVWSISLNQVWETEINLMAGWVTAGEGIDINNNAVSVDYDNTSIGINSSDKLEVKDYSTIVSWAAAWATAVQANDLATVAMTGNYCDLINKPEIPSAQIQSDWEQTNINLADYIKNKPTIGNATITLQKNGSNVDTFELNQTADKCINLVLSKGDVGLANVDNTSDADKPVSDATLAALSCKQDNITDLNTIRSNACAGKTASETIANYWNIVTHNVCEFATSTQGWKADTAVQPGDLCTVATTGAYSDLTGTPALCPIATSGSYTDLTDTPALCTVATTWAYGDLTGTPVLCNVATSWKYCDLSWTPSLCTVATTWAYSDLTGTPNLSTVATSGKYCDLTGAPNLCTIATSWKYCDLTGTPLLCNIATTAQYSDLLWIPNLCTVATSGKYCDLSWLPTIPTVINTLTSSCTTEALSAKQGCVLNTSITSINWKIPSAATTENQLADKAFVNSSINAVAAYYITKDAQWDQFATKAELDAATVYYSGWVVRVPTRNDYTIVASDETHDNATTRYSYNNGWEYQYTINETPLTQAQLNALNSGITSGKVSSYDSAVTTVNSLCTVATSGKYCDLTGTPTIPTNNNQLANGCGYTTCTGTLVSSDLAPYAKACTLCTVATSWKYCDLTWKPTIPTDNCQLANWCWYITNAALSTYAKCSDIPTNNNQLVNGCGYTTCTGTVVASDLIPYAKSCDLKTVATSGKYCDLTGLPTIPTNNNQLTNGCWYTTCTGTLVAWDLAPYAKSCTLCTVATSGKYCDLSWTPSLATVAATGCYNDLTGKPTIPTKVSQLTNDCNYINKDVNNLSCYTPTSSLSTVATSGAYCDLSWKPTLACVACSGSYEDLTCKPNLWVYQTTANMVCTLSNADDSHYPSAKTVADALSCAGAWDMLSSMYDPNGKCADAFDYTNFINTPLLCTVATSGKYCDLTGTPTIPAALSAGCAIGISSNKINVQYDWSTIKKNSWNCLYADFDGLATVASLCPVATSWQYCDLTGTPTIPTNNNQLTNGCGYTTCTWTLVASDLTPYAKTCTLCAVATSWKYCDLTGTPTIPAQLTSWTWVCIENNKVNAQNLFVINEDAIDVTYTWELWVDPYNANYCYTNVCINPDCWIKWIEGATYIFNLDTKVATSACRNVRLKIWNGDYIPLMGTSAVAAWSSYFVKASIRPFQYSTKYISTWWLHVVTDANTTYSAMSVAEWKAWTCTSCRSVRADYLKQIIQYYNPTDNCQLANGCWYTTCTWTLSSCSDVIWALWYTPYNSTNPNGYTTCTGTLTNSSLKTVNGCCLIGSWDICIQWWVTSVNWCTWAVNVCEVPSWWSCWQVLQKTSSWCWWATISLAAWDMCYADYNWASKSWATITLDLNSTITPSANFTVNKPSTIKEWQTYVLRVNNWSTTYTMSLGTWVSNPRGVDLTLTSCWTDQFVFLATSSSTLELQKESDGWDMFITKTCYTNLPASKDTDWRTYFIIKE